LFSQTEPDSLPSLFIPDSLANRANLRFERNINTYLWNFQTSVNHTDSILTLRLADQFASTYIRNNFVSFRDENTLKIEASHTITNWFSVAGESNSFILSDNQSLGTSKAGIHSLLGGVSYRPVSTFVVSPLVGIRYDTQQGEEDTGVQYKFLLGADSLQFAGYRARAAAEINQSDLQPRKFGTNEADLSIATSFAQGSTDSLHIRWFNNRWDFYIPADTSIQKQFGVLSNIRSRTEQQYSLQNTLQYEYGSGFSTQVITTVESRTIANGFRYKSTASPSSILFNTTVQEFRLNGGVDLRYHSEGVQSLVGIRIGEQDEKHLVETVDGVDPLVQENAAEQENRLNNTALQTTLLGSATGILSSSDVLVFDGSASILRYDTPDSSNTDDRDELLINLSLQERHRFNRLFEGSVTAEATLSHTVYLHRDKSANNNWNRIIRISPVLTYNPSERFRMVNTFEVLANYTVFDFEDILPSLQSYSYRQVAFLDSTSYDMTERIGIDMFGYVRIFERGEFSWSNFSERPQQYIEEVTFSPRLRFNGGGRWLFAVGFRSFAQKRFQYVDNVRRFENTYLSAGPTTQIRIRLSPDSLVEINGWKEFQRNSGQKIRDYSNIMMTIRYLF
jgi:hypothetical protein